MDFSHLYLIYYPKLLRTAILRYQMSKEDAENIVQDLFMGLLERNRNIEYIVNKDAYIFKLLEYKYNDFCRHRAIEQRYAKRLQKAYKFYLSFYVQSSNTKNINEELLMDRLPMDKLGKAINSLPPKCRLVFILHNMEGLKYREISKRLGISVNTVESQMVNAFKKLRSKLYSSIVA